MRLCKVARAFDTLVCTDGYTGAPAFKAQLGLFDDNKRDSETAERRVLSVAGDAVMPARRVVLAAGTRYIMGQAHPDVYLNEVIRVGYTVHEATHLAEIQTLLQIVTEVQGTRAYAGRSWVKNLAYSEQSSELDAQFHLHFSTTEMLDEHQVVTFAGRLYLVRSVVFGASGMLVVTCDELPARDIESAVIYNGTFDAVLDEMVTVQYPVNVLRVRWQSLFKYGQPGAPKFGPDDVTVIVPPGQAVESGQSLLMSDGLWYIASADVFEGVWLCRITQHA